MHLDLIQMASVSGKAEAANDDRLGCADRHAWVIDGATDLGEPGLLGGRGGAAWLAAVADRSFAQASGALADLCGDIFDAVAQAYQREKQREPVGTWELPSAAFAAVALEDDRLTCAHAADCSVLLRCESGVSFVTPEPDRRREQAAAAALGVGATAGGLRSPAVLADQRAVRGRPKRRVLGVDAQASREAASYRSVPVSKGDELLLMSDGFSALLDSYALYDPHTIFAALPRRGLAGLIEELRAVERDDATSSRYPRFKPSDDASALWLRVS
ncbi:protein phosphatase 2C domain-containing protein [Novosphingobium rosa]|uniref:protein phosphatase 2C domain-containing protein n=1 Tax=Novosphingobium rosa TaxID=76978 RepID=UPI0008327E3F|nr:protein phosphatase 2C domain-containing protein [Novosphingobium rosa]